ncbi:MAG: hypothetical protein HOI95_11760 [Chromatiales bacterium]|nr:hypothetical protein [Chromatiales bacterium]
MRWHTLALCAAAVTISGPAMATGEASLRGALDAWRNGNHELVRGVFSRPRGSCQRAFKEVRDQSDCMLLVALHVHGTKAFCLRELEHAQAVLKGIREAGTVDPTNAAPLLREIDVLLQAEYEHGGAARYLDPKIKVPLRTTRKLIRQLRPMDDEAATLLDARLFDAFGKESEALEMYGALAPHGAPGGAKPSSTFVVRHFNWFYGKALLNDGDARGALAAAERQFAVAPDMSTSYQLKIDALRDTGQRKKAEIMRDTAYNTFNKCFRFAPEDALPSSDSP